MRRANPIDEEQLPETNLIKRSFLPNSRMEIMEIIILVGLRFLNRVGHRYTRLVG